MDGRQGAAYVHTLQGADHVGPASIMLSYTWGYTIGDIIDVLNNYCTTNNLNPKEVYVWIDCLCVNQHRVIERKRKGEVVPFEEFESVFFKRVTSIGHILAMVAPWTKPEYLSRVWCIFELFTASQIDGCKVTIEIPSREREDFLDGLVNDYDHIHKLFGVLSSTDVEKVEASYESDRNNILNIVKTKTGYEEFNITINNLIRNRVLRFIEDTAQSKLEGVADGKYDKDCADFHHGVGFLIGSLGEYKLALDMYNVVLKMVEKEFGSDHDKMLSLLFNIAVVLVSQGKYEEALNNYTKALTIAENNVPKRRGKYEEVLDNYSKTLTIAENKWISDSERVTFILSNMSEVYRMQRKYEKAIDVLNRAFAIHKEKFGQDHWRTADTLVIIVNVLVDQGKLDEAIKKYQQIMPIYEKKFGSDSVQMALLLHNIAETLGSQGKYKVAMEKFNLSLAIEEKVLGTKHAKTIRTRNAIESLKRKM
jgi:tetratricopeptide (TPR) repeat protein